MKIYSKLVYVLREHGNKTALAPHLIFSWLQPRHFVLYRVDNDVVGRYVTITLKTRERGGLYIA